MKKFDSLPKFSPEASFDQAKWKLVCYVMEGVGLAVGDRLSLHINRGKNHYKTTASNDADPVWNEIFLIEIHDNEPVKFEIQSKGIVVAEGQIPTTPNDIPQDKVVDEWLPLTKVNRKDPSVTGDAGSVHIRLYLTKKKETGPVFDNAKDDQSRNIFKYKNVAFKTGDLILYEGQGVLDVCSKLTSGTPYSGVGMVVELEAKYTRYPQLYVLEYSRNLDKLHDGFRHVAGVGVHLFPLFERIHQYPGTRVHHCPLKVAIANDPMKNLIDWIWEVHEGTHAFNNELDSIELPKGVRHYINETHGSADKLRPYSSELCGASLILNALKLAGLHVDCKSKVYYPPIAVLGYPFIGDPAVIREPAPDADKKDEEEEKLPAPAPEPISAATQKKSLKRIPTVTAKKPKEEKKEEKDATPTTPKPAGGDAAVDVDVFNAVDELLDKEKPKEEKPAKEEKPKDEKKDKKDDDSSSSSSSSDDEGEKKKDEPVKPAKSKGLFGGFGKKKDDKKRATLEEDPKKEEPKKEESKDNKKRATLEEEPKKEEVKKEEPKKEEAKKEESKKDDAVLKEGERKCGQCGLINAPADLFCIVCGASLEAIAPAPAPAVAISVKPAESPKVAEPAAPKSPRGDKDDHEHKKEKGGFSKLFGGKKEDKKDDKKEEPKKEEPKKEEHKKDKDESSSSSSDDDKKKKDDKPAEEPKKEEAKKEEPKKEEKKSIFGKNPFGGSKKGDKKDEIEHDKKEHEKKDEKKEHEKKEEKKDHEPKDKKDEEHKKGADSPRLFGGLFGGKKKGEKEDDKKHHEEPKKEEPKKEEAKKEEPKKEESKDKKDKSSSSSSSSSDKEKKKPESTGNVVDDILNGTVPVTASGHVGKKCEACGAVSSTESQFCEECGVGFASPHPPRSPRGPAVEEKPKVEAKAEVKVEVKAEVKAEAKVEVKHEEPKKDEPETPAKEKKKGGLFGGFGKKDKEDKKDKKEDKKEEKEEPKKEEPKKEEKKDEPKKEEKKEEKKGGFGKFFGGGKKDEKKDDKKEESKDKKEEVKKEESKDKKDESSSSSSSSDEKKKKAPVPPTPKAADPAPAATVPSPRPASPVTPAKVEEAPKAEAAKPEPPKAVEVKAEVKVEAAKPAVAAAPVAGAGAVAGPTPASPKPGPKNFGQILHLLVNRWKETESRLGAKDFEKVMLELKFDEQTATAVFESLDKDAERKILATDVQGAFATALCLLNISVGDLGKRATLGLNWSKAKATGLLHRRDATKFLFSFLFLGKSILAVVTEKSMEWISKADIFGSIKKLYDDADTDNDDQVSFAELAAWMQRAEAEISWLKNLCVEIKAFHAPK